MSYLALSVGNTNTLAVLLSGDLEPVEARRFPTRDLMGLLPGLPRARRRGAACVVRGLREPLMEHGFRLLGPENFGLPMEYSETVGPDRLAGAWFVRAWVRQSSIVVDAGSAITVDAVGESGEFLGGVIVPGRKLLLRATRALDFARELALDWGKALPLAHDTPSAVSSGISLVLSLGVREVVREQCALLGWRRPKVLLTGGDAHLLRGALGRAAYEPLLVPMGVAAWLREL